MGNLQFSIKSLLDNDWLGKVLMQSHFYQPNPYTAHTTYFFLLPPCTYLKIKEMSLSKVLTLTQFYFPLFSSLFDTNKFNKEITSVQEIGEQRSKAILRNFYTEIDHFEASFEILRV